MWFLKRAAHLTPEQFRTWWLEKHCFDVARAQAPHLRKYVINVRVSGASLGGEADEPEWDGVAEQWFEDEQSFNAAYAGPSPTRPDTLAHTSQFMRLIVTEHEVPTRQDPS